MLMYHMYAALRYSYFIPDYTRNKHSHDPKALTRGLLFWLTLGMSVLYWNGMLKISQAFYFWFIPRRLAVSPVRVRK
jgi:hypothetical protein